MGQGASAPASSSASDPSRRSSARQERSNLKGKGRNRADDDSSGSDDGENTVVDTKGIELKQAPPAVYRSNENHDVENPIKNEIMGENPYEEDLSPAVLERLQRIKDEKRRKELDKERSRDLTIEYNMLVGSPCSGSNEFNRLIYTLLKICAFIIILAVCVRTINGDYALKECYEVSGQCLEKTTVATCVPFSNPVCTFICNRDLSGVPDTGCQMPATDTEPTVNNLTCIPDFDRFCVDKSSCASSHGIQMKSTLKYTAAAVGIALAVDLLYIVVLINMKGLHYSDFERLSGFQKVLTLYAKLWEVASQIIWFLALLAAFFMLAIYLIESPSCDRALTPSGSKYLLFYDVEYLLIGVFIAYVLMIIIGTYMRSQRPLRGQLYSASNDNELAVPFGIDCKICRDSSKPRWISGLFRPHMHKENALGCFCNCTSCLIDCTCCLSFEIIGYCVEKCFKHRHFIGP